MLYEVITPDMLAEYTGDETDFSVVGKGGAEPYSFRQVVTNEYYQEYLNESYVQPEELVFGINTLTAAGAGWKIPFAGQLWDSIYIGNNTTISFDGKNREIGDIYPYPPMISSFYRITSYNVCYTKLLRDTIMKKHFGL